jgi:hypothetical protein
VEVERDDRETHYGKFEELGGDSGGALAVAVGQKTARHGKEDERKGEKRADQWNQTIAQRGRQIHPDNDVDHEKLQRVVVERRLKLCGDEAPESTAPVPRFL